MGKAGKKNRGEKKRMQKRAKKAANRAMYDSWRNSGTNSKRQKKNAKKKKGLGEKGKHLVSNCGNVGCASCFPKFAAKKIKALDFNESMTFIKEKFPLKAAKPAKIGGNKTRKVRGRKGLKTKA